jgi:hypothetical protein
VTPGRGRTGSFDRAAAADRRQHEVVGEDDTLGRGQLAVREPDDSFAAGRAHAQGQAEVDRELEVHVEELGP